jgi:hypothetical protein
MVHQLLGAGIAQPLQPRTKGWTARIRFPARARFVLLHNIQSGSGAHSAYVMGTGGCFPKEKAAGA